MIDQIDILHKTSEYGNEQLLPVQLETIFWILMSINVVFIAIAKSLNQTYISSLFTTAILNRQLLQKIQEELKLNSASSILLTITYFNSIAVLVSYLAAKQYGNLALIIAGILIGGALIKWFIMWFISFIGENRSGIAEHGMNHLIYYQVTGLILTPILIFSHFFSENVYYYIVLGCLVFAGLIIIFRELQSIGRALKARIGVLYIILYLCTLEILPLVLFMYAFVNDFAGLN
ncbi:MAG: DUF4271 domain-containing protein [Crocinitomicaceae bacterium]|nr:DUF4271 domain-containing protein [Crocinitomicaceae bacterium]